MLDEEAINATSELSISSARIERERLADLDALRILDTAEVPAFDHYTALLRNLFDTPMAFISFVDKDRQWFKSRCGLSATETTRNIAFCSVAIEQDVMMVVPDAHMDPRFADNPLVVGDPYIRFYAGCILLGPHGMPVGTCCIADSQPRQLTERERGMLLLITKMLQDFLILRFENMQLSEGAGV